ncbi:MAG: hypothetical protein IPM36_20760 [Lewinellaceae bacterium]|nr:hypothetical protein [Lewinellaceae bacterium]
MKRWPISGAGRWTRCFPTRPVSGAASVGRVIFHLPYAFHAKRIYVEAFIEGRKAIGHWSADVGRHGFEEPNADQFPDTKAFERRRQFFETGQHRPNTAVLCRKNWKKHSAPAANRQPVHTSIFLALMSTLEADRAEKSRLAGKRLGFVAYGSGSKAKVFEAVVQSGWEDVVRHFRVFEKLAQRQAVSYAQYEALHQGLKPNLCTRRPGVGGWNGSVRRG